MITDVTAPARTAVNLRRAGLVAACLGVASFVVLVPLGYPLAAAFCCAGLGLGLLNTALIQRSAARFAALGNPSKKRFAGAVLVRLALITVLALSIALLVQPAGLGVFAGLAIFQLSMIFLASVPLLRELRQSAAAEDQSAADTADGRSGAQV